MPDKLLRELFAKYLDDTISPEEFARLYEMIQAGYKPGVLDELLEVAFSNPALPAARGDSDNDRKEVFASLLTKIGEKQKKEIVPPAVIPFHRRRWFAAGAAALLLLLAGSYWMLRSQNTIRQVAVHKKAVKFDAPPGMDGAVLTLADGHQVDLDSTCNGTLKDEGNVSLVKQGEQLRCKPVAVGSTAMATSYNIMTTARGKQFQLVLSDGSKVWLNASSSIRFPTAFAGNERRVEVSGEVYFEVTHDKSRPFVVQAGTSAVEVLGTHFEVMNYNDEKNISATLLEGSIKLTTNAQQLLLVPGEQGRVDKTTGKLSSGQVDTEEVIAWTKGRLAINNSDFASLMRQISRWYDVDVVFQGNVPNVRIGGLIHRDVNLSVVLDFLAENGVHYKAEGRTVTILP